MPRYPEVELEEVITLAREGIRQRLTEADTVERARFRAMALHQRFDFVLTWLQKYSKHFSMAWIARRIGVSRQAISKIRKGEAEPQRLLIPLAEELGVDHRFLTEGLIDFPPVGEDMGVFAGLPEDLVRWAMAKTPGRAEYVRAALELARAAEARNVDLRFFEQVLRLFSPEQLSS